MIVKNNRHYYGLHLLDTAITDTDPKSPDYLRISNMPVQLTSGKNLIKLYGNYQAFLPNSILYVEVLDSEGKVVYSEIPNFTDSGKRKLLIIEVTDDVASGPALITIASTLHDYLVPPDYAGIVNFKWQNIINVIKYESNTSEIIYQTPPEVLLQTRIRPFVTTSFRNSEETSTREYGDYEFLDYAFSDYVGDADSSGNIFQKDKAYKQLTSFTSGSISSFNRNNSFYLKEENFSAKSVQSNYPDLIPGSGFFIQFGDNIVRDGTIEISSSAQSPWIFNSSIYGFAATPERGNLISKNAASSGESRVGQQLTLNPGSYYLVSYYATSKDIVTLNTYLGYSESNNPGNIVLYTSASNIIDGPVTSSFLLRASDGGPYLWFGNSDTLAPSPIVTIDNIRVQPIIPLGYDFKHESDVIGGYVKIHKPSIFPQYSTDYTILPTYVGSQIISGSTAYSSYIDFILQEKDAAVDDRFYYSIIPKYQIQNPTSYSPSIHKIDKFVSTPTINSTIIDGISFSHIYSQEYSFTDPLNPSTPLTAGTLANDDNIYGTFYIGGKFKFGGLYKYNVLTNQFTILYNFPGTPQGSYPDTKPLFLPGSNGYTLYGTTFSGGKWNSGSLYKHDINAGTTATIYSFGKLSSSGFTPAGPVMQASNGLLYGTTFAPYTGTGYGMLYSFNTASNSYSIVHRTGSYGPTNLLEYDGYLWGTTSAGGLNNKGTIFKYEIASGAYTTLYDFNTPDEDPRGLTMGAPGVFYGMTRLGNRVFKYDSNTSTYSIISTFTAGTHGSGCERPLLLDSNHLYGVCNTGGSSGLGTVFSINLDNTVPITPTVIRTFTGNPDGSGGKSSLLRVGNSLYGTNTNGGTKNLGAIFRIDREGIFRPYVEKESGIIYHRNAIVPYEIPATSNLIEDYPRWTGPVVLSGQNNLYSIVELEIKNLEPLSGDVSKVQIYAKPKGIKSEFIDLGVYPTTPVDILLDNNYVNHVQYIDSPYRLTGYFKPTVSKVTTTPLEAASFETTTFLKGWNTGSITSSYFKETEFHRFISVSATPQSNALLGSALKFALNSNPSNNGLAYAVYTGSSIPPITVNSDLWEQISYDLFSACPTPRGMSTEAFNYYTASSTTGNNNLNLNNVLMYAGLVTKTASISIEDIYAVSPNLNNRYDPTGSSISASSYSHPLTFNGKLGWKTDTFFIPKSISSTQSLYPTLFFEYNSLNRDILGNDITNLYPHIVEVSNITCREVGDRDYIRNKYWQSYTTCKGSGYQLITTASVSANTDILMDSAKLDVLDGISAGTSSRALGYLNDNRLVFQTVDSYKFYKNVPYIVSFNAVSQINTLNSIDIVEAGDPRMQFPLTAGSPRWSTIGSWNEGTGYKVVTFTSTNSGSITLIDAADYLGQYIVELKVGTATYSTYQNPTSITVSFSNGTSQTIENVQPNTTYNFIVNCNASTTTGPRIKVTAAYADATAKLYLLGMKCRRYNYNFLTNSFISSILPPKSKLRVFGVNSSFGVPFADQLATPEIGEFIGELEHITYYQSGELKNFGRIEMEFEAETDGFGYIAFETDLGATWYISEISIKPKDRIGSTPGVTRLFVKLPNDLVNKPLSFKVEYLNDIDEKAPYSTMLNDIVFSNINEQQSGIKNSVDLSSSVSDTSNTNLDGANNTPDDDQEGRALVN